MATQHPIAPLHADTRYELRARAVAARSPHLVLSHISAAAVLQLPISGTKLDAVHLTRIRVRVVVDQGREGLCTRPTYNLGKS